MKPNALTRRQAIILGAASAGSLSLAAPLSAQGTTRTVEVMAMGAEDAPVTVIEYASLTCPHCARFHIDVFDKIKANYIETGKVRFIVRDVYFDRYGLWGAMVARCGGQDRYFGIVDRLYARQSEWSRLPEPADAIAAIFAIGRQAGLTDEEMDACVQDQAFAEALVAEFQKTTEADGVQATPTFIINGRKEENMGYEEFAAKLDAELNG